MAKYRLLRFQPSHVDENGKFHIECYNMMTKGWDILPFPYDTYEMAAEAAKHENEIDESDPIMMEVTETKNSPTMKESFTHK